MMRLRILLTCLAVLLLVFAIVPTQSSACDSWASSRWDVRGFGNGGNLYGLGYIPVPPYYAIHPPVYYGQRVYRTYGESPFARPARSSRPEIIAVKLIKNPFCDEMVWAMPFEKEINIEQVAPQEEEVEELEEEVEAVETHVSAQPQMILNPFYKAEDAVAQK